MLTNQTDQTWRFEILRGRQGFAALRPRWQALVDHLPRSTYLQQPGWIGGYLDSIAGPDESLHFVVASRGTELGGVLVLKRSAGLQAWLKPEVEMVTGEHMVLADLVGDARDHSLWPAMLDWLAQQRAMRWAVLRLPAVSASSALGQALPEPGAHRCLRTTRTQSAWLDCSQDMAHATQAVSKSFHQNLNRLTRRARTMGTLDYHVVSAPQALEPALEQFLGVESSGWKRECGTAIAMDPALVRFYHRLVHEFGARGACRINLLTLDGTAIAAQFGLVSDRQLNLLKIGYSQEHADIAPGHLVMRHTIEQVCADPALDRLSFVTHPPWAHFWKPQLTPVDSVSLFPPTPVGRATHTLSGWWQAHRAAPQVPGLIRA
ncbi:GNAT family N-acetyltransferase [Sphaerotilus sp.]|uniref:GNAT family N-acetyltransferase n=1 Tax=Sphaerotilus sp. TaxID=2093942 RepID=UPI0034E2D537